MIWYVEDDASIRDIGIYALNSAGFETRGFEDGLSFWEALKKEKPELIVLDVMLPGMDGIELLSKMKESAQLNDIPVIMATAKGQEYDRIRGLDLGADDYIVKPFSMMEMVSRVKAVLRRSQPQQVSKLLKVGGLVVNLDEHTVIADGVRVQLTYKEFELLRKLMKYRKTVFTRDRLLEEIWGYEFTGETRTVDVHIRTLRQKLGNAGDLIETVRGVGYRMGENYGE